MMPIDERKFPTDVNVIFNSLVADICNLVLKGANLCVNDQTPQEQAACMFALLSAVICEIFSAYKEVSLDTRKLMMRRLVDRAIEELERQEGETSAKPH